MTTNIKTHIRKYDLSRMTVVVTGASSGAGRAAAIEFARCGAKVVVAARNLNALNDVVKECEAFNAPALAVKTDVTNAGEVKELAARANEFGGSIDVWVNNAGVLSAGEFSETPIEIHDRIIRTNLMGYVHGAHAVLPYFKQQQKGVLINNISVGGFVPLPYSAGYSASKFGLRGFADSLRGELQEYPGIHICNLYPAFLDTPGTQHAANFTGKYLRPAPPVYDPQKLARQMVSVAVRPRNAVSFGSVSTLLHLAYFLFPSLTRNTTAKFIKAYLDKAETVPHHTTGNLFEPSEYGTSIHGGWNSDADVEIRRKRVIKSLAVTGFAAALLLLGGRQLFKRNN